MEEQNDRENKPGGGRGKQAVSDKRSNKEALGANSAINKNGLATRLQQSLHLPSPPPPLPHSRHFRCISRAAANKGHGGKGLKKGSNRNIAPIILDDRVTQARVCTRYCDIYVCNNTIKAVEWVWNSCAIRRLFSNVPLTSRLLCIRPRVWLWICTRMRTRPIVTSAIVARPTMRINNGGLILPSSEEIVTSRRWIWKSATEASRDFLPSRSFRKIVRNIFNDLESWCSSM